MAKLVQGLVVTEGKYCQSTYLVRLVIESGRFRVGTVISNGESGLKES